MQSSTTTVTALDGTALFTHRWLPDGDPKAVVQVVHGMAEHSARYGRFAEALTDAGYAVYASDLRGHGRTADAADHGVFADRDAWDTVVADLRQVADQARTEHPGLPVFLVGHSTGSFLARLLVSDDSRGLSGLVLSGTAGDPGALGRVGRALAAAEGRVRGRRHVSRVMDRLIFGQYNAAFRPNRTDHDWLSRDDAEVDAYEADPWCGNVLTSGFYADLIGGLVEVNDPKRVAAVRRDLPVLLVAGDKDPVGDGGKGPRAVARQLREAGLTDVTCTLYPGARHEVLNETNRDEVTADVVRWLDAHLPT